MTIIFLVLATVVIFGVGYGCGSTQRLIETEAKRIETFNKGLWGTQSFTTKRRHHV